MKLTVVVPVFNEEKTITVLINRLQKQKISTGWSKEIIVIDDGSTDKTLSYLKKLKGIKLLQQTNQGKGSAIKTGLKQVKGEYVLIQDADLEYDPKEINNLLDPIKKHNAKVVYGSRNLKPNPQSSTLFYYGGIFLSVLTNLLYGSSITDESTGYKLIQTKLLRSLNLKSRGFGFCAEVTGKVLKKKIPIFEVPITYQPRNFNQGKKIKPIDGIIAAWLLIKYRFQ